MGNENSTVTSRDLFWLSTLNTLAPIQANISMHFNLLPLPGYGESTIFKAENILHEGAVGSTVCSSKQGHTFLPTFSITGQHGE